MPQETPNKGLAGVNMGGTVEWWGGGYRLEADREQLEYTACSALLCSTVLASVHPY